MGDYADDSWDPGSNDSWTDTAYWSHFGHGRSPKAKICASCGTNGLYWQQTERGWRLHYYDSEELQWFPHECQLKKKFGAWAGR